MKTSLMKIIQIALALWCVLIISTCVANKIPWYSQELPIALDRKVYFPGGAVIAEIYRKALMGMRATNTIELVHLHDGKEREVWKYKKDIYLQKGSTPIEVIYDLPTVEQCSQLETNTFMLRGIINYFPFGYLEKSFEWETETFQIKVPKKPDA